MLCSNSIEFTYCISNPAPNLIFSSERETQSYSLKSLKWNLILNNDNSVGVEKK